MDRMHKKVDFLPFTQTYGVLLLFSTEKLCPCQIVWLTREREGVCVKHKKKDDKRKKEVGKRKVPDQ